ncbi:unnamed protein product [Rhizophagus irregularis]|nr:unnamed protein product [Rhizophagus irregularis]CAB5349815.1 unnamed protein product [Rhizophagus irregularis]
MEIERSELNSLKVRDFSLVVHFESGRYENERLLKDCEESLCDYNIVESTANFFLRAELDANTWFKAQRAVYNKIANKLVNYAESEKEYILELDKALKNIKMTLYQYEMLILLKLKSNIGDVRQTKTQAQDKLDSFPKDMQIFKNPLQQLFSSLDALMPYQQNK